MSAPLNRIAAAIVRRFAPEDWRESVIGDLEEEHAKRASAKRYAGVFWSVPAAISSSLQLRRSQRRPIAMSHSPSTFSGLGTELAQAMRSLVRRPAFSLVTIITLTLGIGANTAVYSLANWLLFRPVPGVSAPEHLITIRQEIGNDGGLFPMSVPNASALSRIDGLSGVAGYTTTPLQVAASNRIASRIDGEVVSSSYFDVLGQSMTMGRGFSAAEHDPGQAAAVVISDRLWSEQFGRRNDVLGQTLTVNGRSTTVIGVAARGFRGPDRSGHTDAWMPVASHTISMPSYPANTLTRSDAGVFAAAIARLAPGVSVERVNQQTAAVRLELLASAGGKSTLKSSSFVATPGLNIPKWQREGLRQMLALLLGVASLLLVLTCANVANLLFARSHERAAELATRQALGASRWRTIRQLMLEGLVLTSAGAVLSVAAAAGAGELVNGLVVSQAIPALSGVSVDWRVFAFAAALSIATCIAACLVPAVMGTRVDVASALKTSGRGHTGASRAVRRVLTTVQVAVAVALLAVGLLLVRSMLARYNVPLGYDANRVLAFSVQPSLQGYNSERRAQLYRTLLSRARQEAGVRNAGMAWIEPFRLIGAGLGVRPAGSESAIVSADGNYVTGGFFESLSAALVAGRDFSDTESFDTKPAAQVVIINTALASKLFGSNDVVGRVLEDREQTRYTIVGVVSDLRTSSIGNQPVGPIIYQPLTQKFVSGWTTVHLRIDGAPAAMAARVRDLVQSLDPQLPVYDLEMLTDAVDRHLAEGRLLTRTIGVFAILAVLVAALGLYGVLSRGVEERRREFSIRTALGAGPLAVTALVAREAMTLTLTGAVIGIVATTMLSKYIEARLFGVTAHDTVSLALAIGLAVAAAAVSLIAPVRRAARVDVVSELR